MTVHRQRGIGNAVSYPVARTIALVIMDYDRCCSVLAMQLQTVPMLRPLHIPEGFSCGLTWRLKDPCAELP